MFNNGRNTLFYQMLAAIVSILQCFLNDVTLIKNLANKILIIIKILND